MKKIRVVTSNNRGFLVNLFDYKNKNYEFVYSQNTLYEVNNSLKTFISKIVKWRIFDYIGLFQVLNGKNIEADICFSYNRFLKSSKPYVIFLENPAALVNYCWNRPRSFISRYRLKKLFCDKNLKAIVCMSRACYDGLFQIYNIPRRLNVKQIYPMIYDSKIDSNEIREKCYAPEIECLYISSDFYLKGGRDILNAIRNMDNNIPVHITIISKNDMISKEDRLFIKKNKRISFVEFGLDKEALEEYYKKAAILLNPSRADSFSLVTLEAIKFGCAIIGSDIYAIKEMVDNGENGVIQYPKYRYWSDKNIPNKKLMNIKQVRAYEDYNMTKMILSMLEELSQDREKIFDMCMKSLVRSRNDSFGEKYIAEKWQDIFDNCSE